MKVDGGLFLHLLYEIYYLLKATLLMSIIKEVNEINRSIHNSYVRKCALISYLLIVGLNSKYFYCVVHLERFYIIQFLLIKIQENIRNYYKRRLIAIVIKQIINKFFYLPFSPLEIYYRYSWLLANWLSWKIF